MTVPTRGRQAEQKRATRDPKLSASIRLRTSALCPGAAAFGTSRVSTPATNAPSSSITERTANWALLSPGAP